MVQAASLAEPPSLRRVRAGRGMTAACLAARVHTSARRWEKRGVARTVLLMWRLRFAYWRGGDPDELARHYAD